MKRDLGILVLRLGFGLTMLFVHGLPKLMNFTNLMHKFPDPLGAGALVSLTLAVFAEVFCAAAVAAGLFTRYSAIPLIITMLVAFFIVHGADPFSKKELSFVYMLAFLTMSLVGSGKFSVDHIFLKKTN